jgi:SsrA-binding protein
MASEPDSTSRRGDGLIATNRKASHEFTIGETYQVGIKLAGSEVKSLREKHVSIADAFARADGGELTIYGMHIKPYEFSRGELDPERPRKLLAHKKEIAEMARATEEQGTTLVPLRLDFVRGMAKLTIAIAKGKRTYDKRQAMKKRDAERDIERAFKERHK